VCGLGVPGDAPAIGAALTGSYSKSGFIGGGEAGYNWQIGPAVYGLEIDLQNFRGASTSATVFSDGSFRIAAGTPVSLTSSTDANWLSTIRGRVGYAFDRLLIYGTGGFALTRLRTTFTESDPTPGQGSWTQSSNKAGWVAGGGVEWMLTKNWSVKAEYLHVHFDAITASGTIASPTGAAYANAISTSADLTAEIARAGVNYKF
jgi:outer membrane immunogenic protein